MTAEEYIDRWNCHEGNFSDLRLKDLLIDFAQTHVKNALEAASKSAEIKCGIKVKYCKQCEGGGCESPIVDRDSILNAYPLEKIK